MSQVAVSAASFLADQRLRWRQGDRVRAEAYFQQHPHLGMNSDAALELIWNEVRLRQEAGDSPELTEYVERFGSYQVQIEALFQANCTLQVEKSQVLAAEMSERASEKVTAAPGYEILGELGRGGMGVVYKARDIMLKRVVALKMIFAGAHADPTVRARFCTEAEAIARLQHPNIVQIHEIGDHDGRPFLALEYVEGGTLETRVAGMPQAEREAAQLIETLARAMHYTHQHGILHRDLKPNNILLAADGTPKISDFGLAKLRDTDAGVTKTHALLGTPNYMPPEQAAGDTKNIGVQADVYSLGAILYELLTGRPPFRGTTLLKTLEQVRYQEPIAPRRLRGRMSLELETVCLKCLEKEPANRYQSAAALADDLRRFLDGHSIQAKPVAPWRRAWRWGRRHPALVATIVAAVLLACLAWTSGSHIHSKQELARRKTDDRYQQFARCRDEAFLYGMLGPQEGALFLGAEAGVNRRRAAAAAQQALNLAGLDMRLHRAAWSPNFAGAKKVDAIADCYGLLLMLAGVRGQEGGKEACEESLRILDRAALLRETRALFVRRAYFLDQLGKAAPAREARNRASALPPAGAVDQFLLAEECYRRGDWEEARAGFSRAVTLQPTHFWARFFLAVCHLKSHRWEAAKEGLNGCISQQPDFIWAYLFRSFANEKLQRTDEAKTDFAKALQLDPKDDARYVLHLTRGILHFNQKEWDRALADFRSARALKPDQYNAYLNLAQVHLARAEFAVAQTAMAQALQRRPPAEVVVGYHVERARNLLKAHKPMDALAASDEALELRPDAPAPLEMRGRALLALGRFGEAEVALDRFFATGAKPSTDTFRARGQARMRQGKFPDAVDDYTHALDLRSDADIYQHRGWAHFFADAWKLALRDFSKAIDLDPAPGDAYIGRGLARVMLGDFRAAVADAKEALDSNPETPEMMHNIACIFAQAAALARKASNDPDAQALQDDFRAQAIKAIRQTLAMVPERQRPAFWHAKIHPDSALVPLRDDPAFRQLQKAYSNSPIAK